MSRQRFVQLLIAAVVAISIALFLNARRNQSVETAGVPVFPGLEAELSSVTTVSLQKGSATPSVTLHKNGEVWSVAERADYPADLTKLRRLLMSLGDAKIVEEKTADPQRFASIGVDEPASGATGVEVTVTTPKDKRALIVGKSVGNGSFARKPTDTQSFSIEPAISADADPKYWIDAHLLNIDGAQIQQLDVKPVGGPAYAIHRVKAPDAAPKPAAKDTFTLDGTPVGRKPLESAALAGSTNTLSSLNADDVAPVSSIDFSQASQSTITLADGNVLTLIGTVVGEKHWIQVTSSKDTALTAKTTGRAFDIAPYRYDGIFKPLEQMLVPKEPPVTKQPPVIRGPGASSVSPSSSAVPRPPKGPPTP